MGAAELDVAQEILPEARSLVARSAWLIDDGAQGVGVGVCPVGGCT
jgi:hypothetical protein